MSETDRTEEQLLAENEALRKRVGELERLEEMLRESEERFRLLYEGSPHPYQSLDADGRIVEVNRAWLDAFGYQRDEVIGHWLGEFLAGMSKSQFARRFDRFKLVGRIRAARMEAVRRDGQPISVEVDGNIRHDEDGGFVQTDCVVRNITDRVRAEQALRDSEERYRAVFEQAADSIILVDVETARILEFNDCTHESLGYTREEFEGMRIADFEASEDEGAVRRHLEKIVQFGQDEFETRHRRKDGEIRDVLVRTRALSFPGRNLVSSIMRDITESKRAKAELARHRDRLEELVTEGTRELELSRQQSRRSERLAFLGTYAAGVAHEVNNPLGLISLEADYVMRRADDPEVVRESLDKIASHAERCAGILRAVLRFAGEHRTEKCLISVNELVRNVTSLTGAYTRHHGVKMEFVEGPDLPRVLVSPIEMEQVLMNLISNAVHACAQGGSVRIMTIATDNCVCISVIDDGQGMSEEEMQRAFDPFYTTRFEEGGTGLGLSTSHGIVKAQGGCIELESREGRGTTVTVLLPVESTS